MRVRRGGEQPGIDRLQQKPIEPSLFRRTVHHRNIAAEQYHPLHRETGRQIALEARRRGEDMAGNVTGVRRPQRAILLDQLEMRLKP
jgi:hypothetical protein